MTCWQPRKKATAVTGAGFIETNNQRIVFQSEGQSIDPEDVARTVVASWAAPVCSLERRGRRRERA